MLSVDLPPEPSSATRARALARERLEESCSSDTLDTVALLVTELVTNAILHALHIALQLVLPRRQRVLLGFEAVHNRGNARDRLCDICDLTLQRSQLLSTAICSRNNSISRRA